MKYYIFLIFFSFTLIAQAQSVTGFVRDSLENEPVSYASVRVLNVADSSFVVGAVTNEEGRFRVSPRQGEYIVEISYMGYERYRKDIKLTDRKDNLDLGIINLQKASYNLDETVVIGYVPDIIVKGDTIEYNADAYKVQEDALLQDLVRRIPGMELSADGKLMVNGKVINKILINGKEFFDNDIDMALKNLPASMINKLQVFKEESETTKITGFKDGQEQQVLNLDVKEEYTRTVFGDARIGYGTDHRYSNKINAQYMVDDNQYALLANMNNVTDDFEYSSFSGQYDGISKNRKVGFNFNTQRNENLQVGGYVSYESNDNLYDMDSNTETFIESGNRMNKESSSSQSIRKNLNTGTNLMWKPDTLTTIYARFSLNTGTSDEMRHTNNQSYTINQKDTTSGWTDYFTKGNTHSLNASFTIGRKLNSKGRTVSLAVNGSTRGTSNNGSNLSTTLYQGINETKLIDQKLNIGSNSNNIGFLFSFVEPVGKGKLIQLSYNYRYENSSRDRLTYKRDGEGEYAAIDTAYTRISESSSVAQRINLSFQSIKEKLEYTIGFNIDPSSSWNKSYLGDTTFENQKQSVLNFSPTFRFSYKPKKNMSIDFDYYGSTEQPSLRQLSSDTIIMDALSRMYGNPDLKPSFQNNVNLYFQRSDYEKGSYFTLTAGGNFTINKIVDYKFTDELGNTENTFRNVNGNWGLNGGMMFSLPLRNKKITLDNTTYGYLMRNIGFSNGRKNVTKNLTFTETFAINYRTEKFTQRLQANLNYNITRNNLPDQQNLNVTNYGFKSFTIWNLPYDFTIQNEISFTKNNGYVDDFKDSEFLWNLSVGKQFLRKKQGTIKLQCYDIFNDRNNVLRVNSANYISDTRTNMIGRYAMLSFSYKFNVMPKTKTSGVETTDY